MRIAALALAIALMVIPCVAEGGDQAATLTVYRSNVYGGGRAPSIYVDGQQIVRLGAGRVLSITITPGKHVITGTAKENAVEVTAEPGKQYFVYARLLGESVWKRPQLFVFLVSEDQGTQDTRELRPID